MTAAQIDSMRVAPETEALWGVALQPAGCPRCGRVFLVPAQRLGVRCPACAAAALAAQPARLRLEPPELAVPFRATASGLSAALDEWTRAVWLRPKDLSVSVLGARLVPLYVPMWLVDAEVSGNWQAQAGYDYQVASANEHFQDGRWSTQRVTETRIRWEPRAGQVRRGYQNVAAPALDEHARLTARLGDFAVESAGPYAPAALAEAIVRLPNLEPDAAWPFARARLDQRVTADLQSAAGAQHLEQARLALDYQGLHWTQLLLPVFATAYQDDDGHWIPVLINGQTGRISGLRRASQKLGWQWTGAIAAVALVLFILAAGLSAAGVLFPPLVALGGVLMLVSFAIGLLAPIPAVWAWQHNRSQPVESSG
jgi:hypothetical protein